MFVCQFCDRPYTRKMNFNGHLRTVHANEQLNKGEWNVERKNGGDGGTMVAMERRKNQKLMKGNTIVDFAKTYTPENIAGICTRNNS